MRIDKFICDCSVYTRSEARKLLSKGRVSVDGNKVLKYDFKIDENSSIVCVDNNQLHYKKNIYLMLNKPKDTVSATEDNKHKTVIDLVPDEYRHFELFPVGRLDIDTEGLLFLTNDGQMAHNLISPKKEVYKTYYAELLNEPSEDYIEAFADGVVLEDGYKTFPARIKLLGDKNVEVQIYEGKFHQVKRMFESLDNKVVYLKRVAFGDIALDENLQLGQIRELTDAELIILNNGGKK